MLDNIFTIMELIIFRLIRIKMSKKGRTLLKILRLIQLHPPHIDMPGLIDLISPPDDLYFEKRDLMTIKLVTEKIFFYDQNFRNLIKN